MCTTYSRAFYASFAEVSRRSAQRVVPLLLDWVEPRRVVDVGCGVGTWLAEMRRRGVEEVLGLDGAYVDPRQLEIPVERFRSCDLRRPPTLEEPFDLALCLEVAEHLPEAAAEPLVDLLTGSAPVVAFSAAVPGQGGTGHIHERWPEYWAELFAHRGFVVVDSLRPRLWNDEQVAFYYAQNMLLFVRGDRLAAYPQLAAEASRDVPGDLARIHPGLWLQARDPRQQRLKATVRALPHAVRNAFVGVWRRLR